MKKYRFLIAAAVIMFCSFSAIAQTNHSMSEFENKDTLRVCFDNPITILQKDSTFSGTPYWITENGETHHGDEIIIDHNNCGWLLYAEKEPEKYKNIYVMFQPLPDEETFHIFLEEDEIMVLKATSHEIPGFEYEWWSSIWQNNTVYNGYGLPITGKDPGTYYCFVSDHCNTGSLITFIVDRKPSVNYVTTNLQVEKPMVYWETYPNADFDSIGIYRNNTLIGTRDFLAGSFNDLGFDEEQPKKYRISAWKNGTEFTEPSKEKRPMWLHISESSEEGIKYGWWPLLIENGKPIEYIVRYYQLYEQFPDGSHSLIRSMIPATETELTIENEYSQVVLAAVLHDGTQVFSNIVRPNDFLKVSENHENAEESFGYIYPNPTNGTLNLPEGLNGEYKIVDVTGKSVMQGVVKPEINVSSLATGLYTLIVNNGKIAYKFIREWYAKIQPKNRTFSCDLFFIFYLN